MKHMSSGQDYYDYITTSNRPKNDDYERYLKSIIQQLEEENKLLRSKVDIAKDVSSKLD